MKKLRVTLNGKTYEVAVEVLEDDEGRYPGAGVPVLPPPAAASPQAPAPASPPRFHPPATPAAAGEVVAPIVGTVSRILVDAGESVTVNQPIMILDAMKMDTYINSPRDGTVEEIHCKVGESVQVGQKLVTFR